uniref:Flagellar protein FliL n=1 Tax=Desulfacinum infernum TaxID=35837 RepID=A0A832EJ76_9BACT
MANGEPNSAPSLDGKSASGRHDSVFVVENTDMDLASLFASIEKKEPAPSDKAAAVEAPSEPDPAPSKAAEPSVDVAPPKEKSPTRRALLVGLLGVTLAAATVVGARHFISKPSLGIAAKNSAQVRHAIVVPSAVERLEVFFPAQSKEKEDLLVMTVAVHAGRPNAEDVLSSIRVALRDAVYTYLSQQHPEKNVRRSWAPIVEKELLAELQKRFPQANITAVELEELQKI